MSASAEGRSPVSVVLYSGDCFHDVLFRKLSTLSALTFVLTTLCVIFLSVCEVPGCILPFFVVQHVLFLL